MFNRILVALVCLVGVLFASSAVWAAGKSDWHLEVDSPEAFAPQAAEVRKEMAPGGRFADVSPEERARVEADLDRIARLLQPTPTRSRLNDRELVDVANAQERINAILTKNDGDRLICKLEPRTGTRFKSKVCLTQREWTEIRDRAVHTLQNDLMLKPPEPEQP